MSTACTYTCTRIVSCSYHRTAYRTTTRIWNPQPLHGQRTGGFRNGALASAPRCDSSVKRLHGWIPSRFSRPDKLGLPDLTTKPASHGRQALAGAPRAVPFKVTGGRVDETRPSFQTSPKSLSSRSSYADARPIPCQNGAVA